MKPKPLPTPEILSFPDGGTLDYLLYRSKRKTLSVEITREGQTVVRAPLRLPAGEIAAFLTARRRWIGQHQDLQRRRALAHPTPDGEEEAALRARARAELPPLVALYAEKMGVRPSGITITGARTRFGSCSAKNRLCFSFRLMQYPRAAVEYVVVHELCHILVKDHSSAFYAQVEAILPDWRARQALLR